MKTDLSQKLFEKARGLFPGGVNSPVRAFKGVGGTPRFFARGKGSRLWDVDGNQYLDYVGSWGPLILGHCHPEVMREVQEAMKAGSSFGAPSPREIVLGELVRERMPWIERMRFVSSGSEATTAAIRLARGFTGRIRRIIFEENLRASVPKVDIERFPNLVAVNIWTAKPGIVMDGRKGAQVKVLRQKQEELVGSKVKVDVAEITQPDLDDRVLVLLVREDPAHGIVLGGLYAPEGVPDDSTDSGHAYRYSWITRDGQRICLDQSKNMVQIGTAQVPKLR